MEDHEYLPAIGSLRLEERPSLPAGYHLDRDPDILILRRHDGSMVAAFSARGAVNEVIEEVAEEDRGRETLPDDRPPARVLWRVCFFGSFEILCNGESVTLCRNGKALALLKYLLANRMRPVSQDHLMVWLWPDSNLKKARWSLNSAVYALRKLLNGLNEATSPATCSSYISFEEGYYRLSPDLRVSSDVDEFQALCESGRRLWEAGQEAEACVEYERASELYRGDYLVEDLYEDWTMIERERLACEYMYVLDRLATYYMQTGEHHKCVRACYQVLSRDRCHEKSYRVLMKCYLQLGQRSRGLYLYHLCEGVLKQSYDMAPSQETLALYTRLKET